MTDTERKVKAIIVEKLGVDESEVTANAQFVNDLGADSLDVVEVIMEFEKEFGISIPDDKAEKIVTVGDALEFIEKATNSPIKDSANVYEPIVRPNQEPLQNHAESNTTDEQMESTQDYSDEKDKEQSRDNGDSRFKGWFKKKK